MKDRFPTMISVTLGTYREYAPAQERAMRAEGEGIKSVNIEKGPDGWTVRGVKVAS